MEVVRSGDEKLFQMLSVARGRQPDGLLTMEQPGMKNQTEEEAIEVLRKTHQMNGGI
jgi:hypothetical protein